MKKIVLSGMQSSGILHLGNYIGAILNWKNMIQSNPEYQFNFMIADLHSLTSLKNGEILRKNITDAAKCYIACGILPGGNLNIFQQSQVKEHAELSWIFQTITPLGWMERMTQFKDKSQNKNEERINLGLLSYPALMAADILLYQADFVPVGEDQKQHIELTREIAMRFNREYNCDIFHLPQPVILEGKRIMSLVDGTRKMSKSDENEASRILLTDTNDEISRKISKAKTDAIREIYYDPESRPEISNLLQIIACLTHKSIKEIEENCKNIAGTKQFKDMLIEVITSKITPIRENIQQIQDGDVAKTLQHGSNLARNFAEKTMQNVKKITGLI